MFVINALVLMDAPSLVDDGVIMSNHSPIRELLVLPVWRWHSWDGFLMVVLAGVIGVVGTSVAFVAHRTFGERSATQESSARRRYRFGKARIR